MEMAQLFQRTLLLAEEVSGLGVSVFFFIEIISTNVHQRWQGNAPLKIRNLHVYGLEPSSSVPKAVHVEMCDVFCDGLLIAWTVLLFLSSVWPLPRAVHRRSRPCRAIS